MKSIISLVLFCLIVLFSCTDRDDDLKGVQIRVQNTTGTVISEAVIDSLVFSDLQPEETAFYQNYKGLILPENVVITGDSLSLTIVVDSVIAIDTTDLNLFTYRIFGLNEEMSAKVEMIKD